MPVRAAAGLYAHEACDEAEAWPFAPGDRRGPHGSVDYVVVFGERHLRHVLQSYMNYYNETRTHLSLDKDAPVSRAVDRAAHSLSFNPRRTAPPICPDLIWDRHRPQDWTEIASALTSHEDPLFSEAAEETFDALRARILQLEQEAEAERH